MKRKANALFKSVISLILCFSMLVGTTFAWFTDSVKSGINTIAAGNLDVELYHTNAAVADERVNSETKLFMDLQGNPILWEPGVVSYENLRVANEGDLALAYQLAINTANENFILDPANNTQYGLSQILKVGVVEGGITATDRAGVVAAVKETDWTTLATFLRSGSLLPVDGQNQQTWGVVIYWQPGEDDNRWNLNNGKVLSEGETLQIDLGVKLVATQEVYESDSFGDNYDTEAKAFAFPNFVGGSASAAVVPNDQGQTTAAVTMDAGVVSATVPAGAQLAAGVTKLTLNVSMLGASGSNITLGEDEAMRSLDVHVDGLAENNTVPVTVTLKEAAPKGLNMGNYKVYHVEKDGTKEMTLVDASADFTAHNQFKYDPATGDVTLYMATFSEVAVVADLINPWNGKLDYDWYIADAEELTIANGDQLAGFGAIVGDMAKTVKDKNGNTVEKRDSFSGKTVKLISDINLGDGEDSNDENKIFYPIGYNSGDGKYEKTGVSIDSSLKTFEGTFDGNGHTVSNFYHNTWEMKGDHNWYSPEEQYYRDGMGLFGRVYKGTVKNLTVKNFSSDGEIATTGVIAAYADGATFENIAIFDCNPRVYNIGNGGIVGCVGWYAKEAGLKTTFKNITVDNSNKISALWGSYDVACGGIVGQYYPTSGQSSGNYPVNAGVHFENCHISAQMDVYNDVCANYQYYAYRYTGMLIGSVRENETINGHSYPKMDGITAKDCTVHFGTWNDYYYCEIIDNTTASYTHDYQMSRLEQVKAVNGTTITPLKGEEFTVPSSGRYNYVVVRGDHATENATCYHFKDGAVWTHDMGGIQTGIDENGDGKDDLKEDKQHIYLEFNNLVTGYGWGVTSKGVGDLAGITILDREVGNSVEKFEGKVTELANNKEYKLSDIFNFVDKGVELVSDALAVSVNNLDENNPVSATIVYDRDNWENGTLTLSGTGKVQITIQDYYFCTPTTVTVTITERQPAEKFDIVMNNGNFLHRVGNKGTVALDKLFKAKDGVTVGTVSVTVEAVNGTSASGTYSNNAIQFNNTGVVKVTIQDDDTYCIPTELTLEVVDAVNTTTATSATKNNVVLLNDCGFSSLEVSGGYTLYGNGFTMTCSSDSVAKDRTYSFIKLKSGTLDNVNVIVPNFSHSILFESNKSEGDNGTDGDGRYNNIKSAVVTEGNSAIINSYVSGGRAAVYAIAGKLNIKNSTIFGGAAANIHAEQNCALTLTDVTLIQKPIQATVNDTSKVVMGLSVVLVCDTNGNGAPVKLEGTLLQYAWAHEGYKQYVPSAGQSLVSEALGKSSFIHQITYEDGIMRDSVNLGFVYMPSAAGATSANVEDQRTNSEAVPYEETEISKVAVYTYKSTNGTSQNVQSEPGYIPNDQMNAMPTVSFSDANDKRVFTTTYDEAKGMWKSTLKVDVDAGAYNFSFDKLLVQKYGKNLSYTVKTEAGAEVDKATAINLNSAVSNMYVLEITDNQIYDADGNKTDQTATVTYIFELLATKTSLPAPTWTSKTLNGTPYIVVDTKNSDWNCAVPVLDGLKIKYWSKKQNKEIELDLANVVSAAGLSAGLQNGSNNTITITVADEYTLQITTTGFKTNDNGKPVVVNGKLYFTVSSSSNYVSTNTTSRTPSISYVFTDANNSDSLTLSTSFNVVYATYKSKQYKYSDFCNGTLTEASEGCVTGDTLITLADGTQKRAEDLVVGDMVMVFNHVTGKLEAMPLIFNTHADETEAKNYDVLYLQFSDGRELKIVQSHGLFDMTLMQYVYINYDNYQDYIGHNFYAMNSNGTGKNVKLVKAFIKNEKVRIFCPVTYFHMNSFANGLLNTPNIPGDITGLVNYFEYDPDLKYNEEAMQRDIAKYGLYSYADFSEYISEAAYNSSPSVYLKVAVGKGMITHEQIVDIIQWLLEGSLIS